MCKEEPKVKDPKDPGTLDLLAPANCGGCGAGLIGAELLPIGDYRHDRDGNVPAGECPICGGIAYWA